MIAPEPSPVAGGPPAYPLGVRASHALNLVAVVLLVGSGLQIFDAHPALYAADASDPDRVVLSLPAPADAQPGNDPKLQMTILGHRFEVGGNAPQDVPPPIANGGWLEGGRRLHFMASLFFIANGLLYFAGMALSRRKRAVWPYKADLAELGPALRDHFRIPPVLHGRGGGLNPMQKIAYLAVPGLLAPLLVATGLALSPQWDALVPFWSDLFGGRQFARTWHFVAMAGLIGFIASHILLVALSGRHTIWRMVTGKVVAPAEAPRP